MVHALSCVYIHGLKKSIVECFFCQSTNTETSDIFVCMSGSFAVRELHLSNVSVTGRQHLLLGFAYLYPQIQATGAHMHGIYIVSRVVKGASVLRTTYPT